MVILTFSRIKSSCYSLLLEKTIFFCSKATPISSPSTKMEQQFRWNVLPQAQGYKSKSANRYNQVPHLTQDTNGKVTNSQLDTTNESQEVSPFPAGDHKAHINRRAKRHSKRKTEKKHKRSTNEVPPWNGQ